MPPHVPRKAVEAAKHYKAASVITAELRSRILDASTAVDKHCNYKVGLLLAMLNNKIDRPVVYFCHPNLAKCCSLEESACRITSARVFPNLVINRHTLKALDRVK